jgi:hypothetical protein
MMHSGNLAYTQISKYPSFEVPFILSFKGSKFRGFQLPRSLVIDNLLIELEQQG